MGVNLFTTAKGKIAFQIWGGHREDLTHLLQLNGAVWAEEVESSSGVAMVNAWVVKPNTARFLIGDIQEIERVGVPPDVQSLLSRRDTERFRLAFRKDLFRNTSNDTETQFRGEYQEKGLKRLLTHSRHALFWEMRLGKTPTVIAALNHQWEAGLFDHLLIVCPPESVYNFEYELSVWASFYPGKAGVYIADTKHRDPFKEEHRIVIITYRFLIALSDELYKKKMKKSSTEYRMKMLPTATWGKARAIVCDESHLIKNPKSRSFKILHGIIEDFRLRFLLTGTPAPQGTVDLYSQIKLLDPTLVHDDYSSFLKHVALTDAVDPRDDGNIIEYIVPREQAWLKSVGHLVSRELLINRIEDKVKNFWCKMSPSQVVLYKALVSAELKIVQQRHGRITMRELENRFIHIQLILDNPRIVAKAVKEGRLMEEGGVQVDDSFQTLVQKWKFEDHGKLPVLEALVDRYINQEGNKKLVIWSGHPLTLEDLAEHFEKKKYSVMTAHGQSETLKGESTALRSRRLVQDFWNTDVQILFASYLTLNSAIRLDIAKHSIYFDRPWNWVLYSQSQARINMPGVSEDIEINPLVFMETLEVAQDKTLKNHGVRNDSLWADPDRALTKDELLTIFGNPD